MRALVARQRLDVPGDLGQPLAVDQHRVDVLAEVVDPQRPRESGRPVGGQHVVGPGDVVADRRRRQRPAEHGAGVADAVEQRDSVLDQQLEVLGGDGVGHGQGLVGPVAHDRVATLGQRGLEVLAPGRGRHQLGHGVGHRVGHALVPGDQPGQPVGTVLGLEDHVDRRVLGRDGAVGHDHDLRRAGERRGHADQPLPRHLALGLGHPGRAGADDHVHRADRLGAVGEGADGRRPADPIDLVDPRQGGRGEDAR
jgi:hypothetical protein